MTVFSGRTKKKQKTKTCPLSWLSITSVSILRNAKVLTWHTLVFNTFLWTSTSCSVSNYYFYCYIGKVRYSEIHKPVLNCILCFPRKINLQYNSTDDYYDLNDTNFEKHSFVTVQRTLFSPVRIQKRIKLNTLVANFFSKY